MVTIGIYKIVNPKNKVYIGQSINVEKRLKHYSYISGNTGIGPKLYNSLKKYGYENHQFEIIEECLQSELDKRETFWKKHYLNLASWDEVLFCGLYDNGGGPQSLETIEKKRKALKGKPMLKNRKPISQYSLDGEYIRSFESQLSAAKHLNVTQTVGISECCKGKRKHYKGYIWKFKN